MRLPHYILPHAVQRAFMTKCLAEYKIMEGCFQVRLCFIYPIMWGIYARVFAYPCFYCCCCITAPKARYDTIILPRVPQYAILSKLSIRPSPYIVVKLIKPYLFVHRTHIFPIFHKHEQRKSKCEKKKKNKNKKDMWKMEQT